MFHSCKAENLPPNQKGQNQRYQHQNIFALVWVIFCARIWKPEIQSYFKDSDLEQCTVEISPNLKMSHFSSFGLHGRFKWYQQHALYLQKEKMSTKTNKDVFIKSFRRKPQIVPLAYYNFYRMCATREWGLLLHWKRIQLIALISEVTQVEVSQFCICRARSWEELKSKWAGFQQVASNQPMWSQLAKIFSSFKSNIILDFS